MWIASQVLCPISAANIFIKIMTFFFLAESKKKIKETFIGRKKERKKNK